MKQQTQGSTPKTHGMKGPLYIPSTFETAGEEMLAHLKLKASRENKAIGPSQREAGL